MKVVLVSNCGFWELDNFDPLLAQIKMLCKIEGLHFAGALLRPHGPALGPMVKMGAGGQDVLQAARDAGHQLVESGEISEETLRIVSRELLPRDMYRQIANGQFEQALKQLERKGIAA